MPAAKVYNPADYLPEIHAWIEDGKTLRAYCRQEGKPSYGTVYDWLEDEANNPSRFARARDIGEAAILQDCLEIADTPQIGEIVTQHSDGKCEIKTIDMIEHRKLRIETRLKLLAKWNPKKYGDKMQVEGELGIKTVIVPAALKETADRPATAPEFDEA